MGLGSVLLSTVSVSALRERGNSRRSSVKTAGSFKVSSWILRNASEVIVNLLKCRIHQIYVQISASGGATSGNLATRPQQGFRESLQR
jgi:hypothetical protein